MKLNLNSNMINSMDYSRHLCVVARSAISKRNRPVRSFSDSEVTPTLSQTACYRPYDDFKKRNFPRKRDKSMDQTLKKTFTVYIPSAHASPPSSHRGIYRRNSAYFDQDSFSNSVSSIAYDTSSVDTSTKKAKNERVSLKAAKLQAVEKWLEQLPDPF